MYSVIRLPHPWIVFGIGWFLKTELYSAFVFGLKKVLVTLCSRNYILELFFFLGGGKSIRWYVLTTSVSKWCLCTSDSGLKCCWLWTKRWYLHALFPAPVLTVSFRQGPCPSQLFSYNNRTKNPDTGLAIHGSLLEFPGSLHPLHTLFCRKYTFWGNFGTLVVIHLN